MCLFFPFSGLDTSKEHEYVLLEEVVSPGSSNINNNSPLMPTGPKQRMVGMQEMPLQVWQYRLWSFQGRDTKLERFLSKNQLESNEIIEFCELVKWGGIKKCQNLTFKVNFLRQKSLKNTNLEQIFVIDIF